MARRNRPKKVGRYTNAFKLKAVRLTLIKGTMVQEIAQGLDIHPFMLSRWRKEYRDGKLKEDRRIKIGPETKLLKKIKGNQTLEAENARLRMENDLLKKAIRFSSEKRRKFSNS